MPASLPAPVASKPKMPWDDDPIVAQPGTGAVPGSANAGGSSVFRVTAPSGEEYEITGAPDEHTAVATVQQMLGASGKAAGPAGAAAPPIEVQGPDGAIVEFPAGTDRATMTTALQKHYGGPGTKPQGQRQPWDDDPIVGSAADPWAEFRTPPKDTVAADVAKSGGTGVVRGVLGALGMIPAAVDAAHGFVERHVLDPIFGAVPQQDRAAQVDLTPSGLENKLTAVTGPLHEPQTTAGKYATTIGEFAPSAIAGPGGAARKAAEIVLPAVASEAAGEATAGTALEPYARVAGGLVAGGATGMAAARTSAPERMVARATAGQDATVFQLAQALQDRAAALGVPLSGPEAVQQVTQGGTKLGDLQRVIEGSTEGGARTAPFYAGRPGQVQDATGRVLDQIAPAPATPSTLGPRAAEAAQGALDDVRRGINRGTRPLYAAAEGHVIDPADFAPIGDDPAFQASLRRLRSDEVLGPRYAAMPDNTVGVVDAVTKDMRDRGIALGNAANPGFSSQTAAAYGTGAAEARDIARDPARGGSQAYDDALAAQEQARRQNLNPLQQGPLGQIAAAGDTRAAYGALLPAQPLAGGRDELVDAAQRLFSQDPSLVPALVRQHIADAADASARNLQSGPAQYAGANLVNTVAGTPQQRQNLEAVMAAAGVQSDLPALAEALQATGMRKQPGSATEFNRQIAADLARPGALTEAGRTIATGGAYALPLMAKLGDKLNQAYLGRNAGRLAELFLAPDSATQLGAIAARGAESPVAALFARSALQAPAELRAR